VSCNRRGLLRWAGALAVVAAALASCGRRPSGPQYQRVAILRFENLGADASLDWIGRALPEMMAVDLAAAPAIYTMPSSRLHSLERALGPRPIAAPGVSAERDMAILAGATRLGYGEYSVQNGRLRARITVENPATRAVEWVASAEAPAAGGVAALAASLARQVWSGAARIPVNNAALQSYVAALESNQPVTVSDDLERAIAADPDFAPAYRLLAQVKAQSQDRAGAAAVIARARSRNLDPSARARIELDAAGLSGDRATHMAALETLSRLEPADPTVWRSLASALMTAHRYPEAAAGFRKSAAIDPQDPTVFNEMAYACAYSGDIPAAVEALARYRAARPAEANPLDSLGDVYLIAGRLDEAEKAYAEADRKEPHFQMDGSLFKAAMARLMSGDVAAADGLARKYLDARAAVKDPAVGYRQAEWMWAAGRRRVAIDQMADYARGTANGPLRELAARAHAQIAIWNLALGDRAGAAKMAAMASAEAGPASAGIAAVARFLSAAPASPAEWADRANREFPAAQQAAVKSFALAYALLLQKDFAAAGAVLKRAYDSGEQVDGAGLPVLLAWTYVETGRIPEAAALLRDNPAPSVSGAGPFLTFYFPRVYYLRGVAAQRQGKADQAAAAFQLFKKLSGPDALVWGEEAKAR
jgi:tetratricopeptide (TPR) repeat protein